MKKMTSFLLALMMALTLSCTLALADEAPQPEGGKKFEGNWAMRGGLVEIVYEEEGYRVSVDLFNQDDGTGILWQYACYYSEEKDALESVSSSKAGYALDLLTLDRTFGECAYEGVDDAEETTVFTLSADGALTWKDGRENMGQDLEFRSIGRLEGVWKNEAEDVYTELHWEGLLDENTYFYTVFIGRGEEAFHMAGLYDPKTCSLICYDTDAAPIRDAEDLFAAQDAGKPWDWNALFSDLGGGKLLLTMDNGAVELEYDLLGPAS